MGVYRSGWVAVATAASILSAGCATKKHVREAIAPVQNQLNQTQSQVSALQKETGDQRQAIGDLDRQVATTDEKATEAGRKAAEAAAAAAQANAAAAAAAQKATEAGSAAQQAQTGVARLDATMQNINNYKLVSTDQVHFALGKSVLTKDEQAKLDATIQKLGSMKGYIIEVEGFADRTGSATSNLELSRRRAEAVVHYLAVEHNVPLRSIRQLGVGSDFPDADNKTAEARKENRRVDVKLYQLDLTGPATASAR